MPEEIQKYYMIGNAHLDPVWLWRWQEGSAEAKATIRSALDRMKEYPDFKFVCSSSSVYEWIEEFDHEMFEEIRLRVKEGRFIIVGGMYVQPDCNLPSGEGFARQMLYAQRYFYDKFGVTARVGYNVDSFGHNEMLPQLLKKSGMDYYIFQRPGIYEKELPSNLFRWRSRDGSEAIAYRTTEPYCFNIENEEMLNERLETVASECDQNADKAIFLYGVGNHGGGPTIQNIELIKKYQKNGEKELVFSDPHDFFADARKRSDLPVIAGELQHHASGCYAAVSEIKNDVRRSEHDLFAAEVYTMLASRLSGRLIPQKQFERAWKDVCFLHFHDIISGTAVRSAYEDSRMMAGEARMIAARETNNALQTLSWQIDTSDSSKGVPVIVFNPFPWDYDGLIRINRHTAPITDREGNSVISQHVFSEAYGVFGRSDTLFKAHIPAFGYSTYYFPVSDARSYFQGGGEVICENESLQVGEDYIENEYLRVEFDSGSGWIKSLYDKAEQKELISEHSAVPVVIDEAAHDTWSHALNTFDKEIGCFYDAKISVTERGPVRATLRVESKYNVSRLTEEFSLVSGEDRLMVKTKIDWHEKAKMLKLRFAAAVEAPESYCEIPFGVSKRPCNGEEDFAHGWVEIKDDNGGIAIVNNKKYSYSFKANRLELTAVRSPQYADHGVRPRNEDIAYTDLGEQEFNYAVMPAKKTFSELIRAAREINLSPEIIIENNHSGRLNETYTGIHCSADNVIISALKRAEDGNGIILRAYETDGKEITAEISGDVLKTPLKTKFSPFEVKTLYLDDSSDSWREVMITELPQSMYK